MLKTILGLLCCALGARADAAAPGPLFGRYFLAAGMGDPAYKDGEFGVAEFKAPATVLVSKDGKALYVADTDNHAIRKVSFDQRSKVETLAGGPGKGELISPTAMALSLDGASLFVSTGSNGKLMRVALAGGAVSAYPNALSPLAATSLVAHPLSDRIYALNAQDRSLTVFAPSSGQRVTLSFMDNSGDLNGVLAATPQELYLLNRSSGELLRLNIGGQAPLAGLDLAALKDQKAGWDRVAYLGAGAKGLVADNGILWVWDQVAGLFKTFNPATSSWTDYPLKDFEGHWLQRQIPFVRAPFSPDHVAEAQRRSLLKGLLSIAADPERGVFYVAEQQGNRVVGLMHPNWDGSREDGMPDYVNAAKIPGVTRVLVLGDSMSLSYDNDAGEQPTVEGGFGKKLEAYLNLLSSIKGKGRRFEVLQQSVALGAMGGGINSYYANLPDGLKALKADEVITLTTYMNLNCELLGMTRTKCPDDSCQPLVDPFFFDQTPKQMMENYGPIHRSFIHWLKDGASPELREAMHLNPPGEKLDPGSMLFSSSAFNIPEYRDFVLKVHAKVTGKAVEAAKRDKQRYIQVLLPLRNNLAPGENAVGGLCYSDSTQNALIDGELEKIAADKGCDFINLTGPLRALEPTLFPLVSSNSHHYKLRGLDWAALATAIAYMDKLP